MPIDAQTASANRDRRYQAHAAAWRACYRHHGDGRYNPGSRWHMLRWWLPALLTKSKET